MKYFGYFLFSLAFVTMIGCEDNIVQDAGSQPDETAMTEIGGVLYSGRYASRVVPIGLYEGEKILPEKIWYALTKPASDNVTVTIAANPELVASYNEVNNTKLEALPTANVSFENNGSISMAAGKQKSDAIDMNISTDGLQPDNFYLLPITLTEFPKNINAPSEKQILYYKIHIEKKPTLCEPNTDQFENIPELLPGVNSVFYVNTETYNPMVVMAWGIKRKWTEKYSIGHIVNLKKAEICYEASKQRAELKLGSDLSYILENRDKYIRTLQEYGRKICLCIENGGQGIGFCNLTDYQITDFVAQVKSIVELYELDGVNLWDEDSKYGNAKISTTSYPKLIKSLREALPDKLLTLVDKGNATEYFYDTNQCGGIEVGKYIDYAWHGYCSPNEEAQIINPDKAGNRQEYSQYIRRQIAGLDESKYGSVVVPRYANYSYEFRNSMENKMFWWRTSEKKKCNILVMGGDLIGSEYADKEGAVYAMLGQMFCHFMDDDDSYWGRQPWESEDRIQSGDISYSTGILDWKVSDPNWNNYKRDW